jgi:hypothetical protein
VKIFPLGLSTSPRESLVFFPDKFNSNISSDCYTRSRDVKPSFAIKHYAGKVRKIFPKYIWRFLWTFLINHWFLRILVWRWFYTFVGILWRDRISWKEQRYNVTWYNSCLKNQWYVMIAVWLRIHIDVNPPYQCQWYFIWAVPFI